MKRSELIEERRHLSWEWDAIQEDRDRVNRREAGYMKACWELDQRIIEEGVEEDEEKA